MGKLLWYYAVITCDNAFTASHLCNELSDYDIDMKSNIKFTFEFIPNSFIDFSQNNQCPCRDTCAQLHSD